MDQRASGLQNFISKIKKVVMDERPVADCANRRFKCKLLFFFFKSVDLSVCAFYVSLLCFDSESYLLCSIFLLVLQRQRS